MRRCSLHKRWARASSALFHGPKICGPDAMMDAIEIALKGLGVPLSMYHSERYSFA